MAVHDAVVAKIECEAGRGGWWCLCCAVPVPVRSHGFMVFLAFLLFGVGRFGLGGLVLVGPADVTRHGRLLLRGRAQRALWGRKVKVRDRHFWPSVSRLVSPPPPSQCRLS